jgi:dipeptidyl aminopeptidase/acylaminoacyl peptidase
MRILLTGLLLSLLTSTGMTQDVQRWTANDGQLVLEDIPQIPESLPPILARYQNIRSAGFSSWSKDSKSIFIKTRLGPVTQLHRVDMPGGARYQVTFGDEPVGQVALQPGSNQIALTLDEGGDEFDQVYLLNPDEGLMSLLSDGEALNNRMTWDRQGKKLAYRSTRRNGRSNDIWVQNVESSGRATMVLATDDGTLWKPVDFSRNGKKLLVQQFVSVADSRVHILNLQNGELTLLAGDPENPSSNIASGFGKRDDSVYFVTNQHGGAAELARAVLAEQPDFTFVPSTDNWDITQFVLSPDRNRGAFVANVAGISRLYLFDPERLVYRRVEKVPLGLVTDLNFSPNSKRLGMTLNSARSPNEAYVLELGRKPLSSGKLTRWTFSEAGGLNTSKFAEPIAFTFLSRVTIEGEEQEIAIPAFAYLPPGRGPFPVIIHVHGGPENQFRPRFNSNFQMWIDQLGAAVIPPNVRGSLGYGSYYITMDDGYKREASVEDIGALLDWIAQQSRLDSDRVAITGASYGGYVALASAVHYSDRLRAAVNRVGITNFVTFLENTQDYRRELRRVEYGDERDPEMRAFLERISPLNNVDSIKIPLFIQQGSNDPIVPKSESDQMVKALREQGQTVWYMNALNEGHGYDKKENRDLFQQATFLFLQKYLLGD